ncbi:MAG: hypothetical protein ACRDOK_03075 [Streptosporangiaceae bacterium]
MADYATLLRDHVRLTCRSVDRIFLQAYVPKLQTVGWVCRFLRWQRGYAIPSSAAFGKIGDACVAEVHRFAEANGIPHLSPCEGEQHRRRLRKLSIFAVTRQRLPRSAERRGFLLGLTRQGGPADIWRR